MGKTGLDPTDKVGFKLNTWKELELLSRTLKQQREAESSRNIAFCASQHNGKTEVIAHELQINPYIVCSSQIVPHTNPPHFDMTFRELRLATHFPHKLN